MKKPRSAVRRPRLGSALVLALTAGTSVAHAQALDTPPAPVNARAPSESSPDTAVAEAAPPNAAAAAPAAATAPPAATPESAPAAGTAAPDGTSAAAADAEAAAIQADLQSGGGSSDSSSEFKLNLYGFADFTYSTPVGKQSFFSDYSSFAVGKLNLYAAADLGSDWRSLAEVRFMYLPNGNTTIGSTGEVSRTDTTTGDYTDLNRPVKWGGVVIERAWLEHTFHPLLTVRLGQWLTPYGIWNVDHGSPVIIGVRRPYIVGEALLPERQTGIETYGSLGFGPSQLGYHLTLSNGRGPIDTYQDLDHNKGIGWRLFYKRDTDFGTFTIGTSGYRGKYTDARSEFTFVNGVFGTRNVVAARYDELSLAADAKWEWGNFLFQSEVISSDVAYPEGHRPIFQAFAGPPGFTPDHRRFGVYGLTGYRTSFLGIMPWIGGEYYDPGIHSFSHSAAAIWGGINARPTARVVLKAQYTHSWFPEDEMDGLHLLDLQAAWSF
ncbi:MAG: hypothetical protein ACOY0T_08275 [Myxococcota bacterium]